ncbi:MAG: hypothetical protein HGA95_03755 [Caldiserica bacterium]|nr:hypothetical protein [Caldisericota bacterium]
MNIFFILLRSSSSESSLIIKVIVAILAVIITSIIRANKKDAKNKKTVSKPSNKTPPEPVTSNDQLDNILKNQSKIDQLTTTDDESIWEDEQDKK